MALADCRCGWSRELQVRHGGAGVAGLIGAASPAPPTSPSLSAGSCDDLAMGPAEGSGFGAGRLARPGAGGVVSRSGLFERLGASAPGAVGSAETRRQLELLVMRAPDALRVVLATRHDLRLGLHRLRLEGELTELRAADLRFSLAEARELLAAAGVQLGEPVLGMLYERTEGWAAGLRLAALSPAGHDDQDRFAAEFSGSERTVAEDLLAEGLERQNEEGRRPPVRNRGL